MKIYENGLRRLEKELRHGDSPVLRGLTRRIMYQQVSVECAECGNLYLNSGDCKGKDSVHPCLLFKKNNVINMDDKALNKALDKVERKTAP